MITNLFKYMFNRVKTDAIKGYNRGLARFEIISKRLDILFNIKQ